MTDQRLATLYTAKEVLKHACEAFNRTYEAHNPTIVNYSKDDTISLSDLLAAQAAMSTVSKAYDEAEARYIEAHEIAEEAGLLDVSADDDTQLELL